MQETIDVGRAAGVELFGETQGQPAFDSGLSDFL